MRINVHLEPHFSEALENAKKSFEDDISVNRTVIILFTKAMREFSVAGEDGIINALNLKSPLPHIYAPRSTAPRLGIRIQDPLLMIELKKAAGAVDRPLSVIAYSLLRVTLEPYIDTKPASLSA